MSALAPPASPELALVCPELRQEWLAALPDVDTDWLLRPAHTRPPARPAPVPVPVPVPVRVPVPVPADVLLPAPEPSVPFVVAATVHLGVSILQSLAWGTVAIVIVVAMTLILTLAA